MRSNLAGAYRPKTLDDLVGQEVVVKTLTNAFKNNNLHQAYLFVGRYGSGKTTLGRILAAMENCEVSPGLSPCGSCKACKRIFDGNHTDVMEIDAASAAGKVDQVRQLKTEALYNPVDGAKKKYFIIDECLPYDTMVSMADGNQRKIGALVDRALFEDRVDNTILSQNIATGEVIEQEICRYIRIPNNKQMYEIEVQDENGVIHVLRITGNHNIFVKSKGKIKAEDIEIGQELFLQS